MKKKYVLKNKRRFCIFIMAILISVGSTIFVSTAYSYKVPDYKLVAVRQGDTLWQIADKYNDNGDIRSYIYEIKKINMLKDSNLYEGLVLKIPVK